MDTEIKRLTEQTTMTGTQFLNEIDAEIFPAKVLSCALPMFHITGTCAIGRVVEPNLSLFGIDGLFVTDTSVMPRITAGNVTSA